MALISDLTGRQYAAIGKVACEWAYTEAILKDYFLSLTGLSTELGLKIVSELGSQTLLDMISAIAHDPNKTDDQQAPIYYAFRSIYPKILEMRGRRNRVVHADWSRKGKTSMITLYFQAKGKLVGHDMDNKTAEIETLAAQICNLTLKLHQVLRDHKAGRLVALPPKPPKQPQQAHRNSRTDRVRPRKSQRRSSAA
jgi:hypothetical protein